MTGLTAWLGGVFCAIGVVLGVLAGRHFTRRRAFVRDSAVAQGVVIAVRDEHDGMETQRFQYPTVRFATSSGRNLTFESRVGRGGSAWHVGDSAPVRYLRDHPENAEFDGFVALWGATSLFGLLAVVFLGVGLGLWLGAIPV